MARRKPMMGGMRGGMPMRGDMMGRGGPGGKCTTLFCETYIFRFEQEGIVPRCHDH